MHRFTTPHRVFTHETHVSTQRHSPQAYARFSCPHGDQRWSSGDQCPACQGPSSSDPVGLGAHSFPRSHRLIRPAEFTRVYRQGRQLAAGCLQIRFAEGQADRPRLGLAIAKRVLPRAVDRNRVKRLVRESFRYRTGELAQLDVVVALRGSRRRGVPEDLGECLDRLWSRLAKG